MLYIIIYIYYYYYYYYIDVIGLPIDQDPIELIEMIRSLSDSYMKSRNEIVKLTNSRDQMIEVKRLLEIELNKISKENSEILLSVQEVAEKLEKQSIVIEEQSKNLKNCEVLLKDKDDEILKLKNIIIQDNEKNIDSLIDNNEKDFADESKETTIINDNNNNNIKMNRLQDENIFEIHKLECGTQVCRINDCNNSDDDETEEEKLLRIHNDNNVEEFLGMSKQKSSSSVREILEVITLNL